MAVVIQNPAMRDLYRLATRAGHSRINVLISGETGTGKEILAEAVHRASPRACGPFVCFNCAAVADTLLESELFGHERGAFTGAAQAKQGLVEAASSGTLFLDEIGEMSLTLQAKVLRVIETKQVLRVGATRPRAADVRFVAATNRDLDQDIAAGRFRKDLYFRLNGISLSIPPLRARTDEILPLARLFLAEAAAQLGEALSTLTPRALAQLLDYAWPGNIRELRNLMERAHLLASGGLIGPEHLPLDKMRSQRSRATDASPFAPPPLIRSHRPDPMPSTHPRR